MPRKLETYYITKYFIINNNYYKIMVLINKYHPFGAASGAAQTAENDISFL